MAQKFSLKHAEEVRTSTTAQMQKNILRMYEELYKKVSARVAGMESGNAQKQNLILLQRDIKGWIRQLNDEIQQGVVGDMRIVSNAVVEDTREFLKQCGFRETDIHDAFSYVPEQIIRNIINGNVYQEGWTLSGAIWGYNKQTQDALNKIISIGTAQGKSAYEIAKDIEQYVNPGARKPSRIISSWRYENGERVQDKFRFGKVDYNAQRLARTLISHAYQQSFQHVNKNDPFVTGYRWLTSNFHGRVCPICTERATSDNYGMGAGVFPKDELPLDHPNGMCTFEAVIPDSLTEIARKIGEWYRAPIGTFPEIDRYAQDFMAA